MDIAEWLLNTTQVCVSGACGPRRAQPIECYFPTHQIYSYRTTTTLRSPPRRVLINGVATGVPGGIPREVESSTSDGESGIVFDKDLMSVWRLPQPVAQYDVFFWEKAFEAVLSHNTLLVAIEAFLDDEPGVVDWILKCECTPAPNSSLIFQDRLCFTLARLMMDTRKPLSICNRNVFLPFEGFFAITCQR